MREHRLGSASVAVIGQGTWRLDRSDPARVTRAVLAGVDAGMTHIDTAEMYGGGRVERLLGRILRGRRDQVFLASKVLPHHADRTGTVRACEASLRRLDTDRLDLYLLHWPGRHPLPETLAAFRTLLAQGKVRSYGVSNFDVAQLRELEEHTEPGEIACDQVLYHLGERAAVEQRIADACHGRGIAVVGYSPFGSGRFPPGGEAASVLGRIATARGATPRQVALAYLLAMAADLVIPRTSDLDHARENATADLTLSDTEVHEITTRIPAGPAPFRLPTI